MAIPDFTTTGDLPITVTEHGKAIAVSELLLRASFTDVMSDTALLLGQKNQLWWDLPAAESFRLHQQIYRIEPER